MGRGDGPVRGRTVMPPKGLPEGDLDLRRPASIAAAAVLIGAAGLAVGWLLGSPATIAALSPTMKPNTAVALGTFAASLLLQLRGHGRAGQALAVVGLSIGALTLLEYAAGVDLGIDQVLARDAKNEESLLHPGRMAPNAALGLLLLGSALVRFAAIVVALGCVVWRSARVLDRNDAAQRALAAENERLAREAQGAVRARDEFIAIAAHELRTPLTSLRLQTQLEGRRAGAEGDRREGRDMYLRQIDRLTRLVDGMLDNARIASGSFQLDRSTVDLSTLATHVVNDLRNQFTATGTTPSLRVRPGVLVEGDPLRLEQVVENLLSNALKYGGGKPVEIAVEQSDGRAVLSISDRGIGIDPADQQRIFGLFERAVPVSSFGGLGLGLDFAHQVVVAHGGRIEVRSEPGRGAIFLVSLPALERQVPAGTAAPSSGDG